MKQTSRTNASKSSQPLHALALVTLRLYSGLAGIKVTLSCRRLLAYRLEILLSRAYGVLDERACDDGD
jgi:hypothetical protein